MYHHAPHSIKNLAADLLFHHCLSAASEDGFADSLMFDQKVITHVLFWLAHNHRSSSFRSWSIVTFA